MDKIARSTLRYLFREYLKAPIVPYSINPVTDSFGADASAVSDYLAERNWIREKWVSVDRRVSCRITIAGIEEINPGYLETKLARIVRGLAAAGGTRDLMEIFESRIDEYAIALDIVYELEKLELVKLYYQGRDIIVELTDRGWAHLYRKRTRLFPVVAVA